jgi:hypothetical protein
MNPGKLLVQLVILGVVVVALIFIFTFVNTSQTTFPSGGGSGDGSGPPTGRQLEFPEMAGYRMTHEWKTPGQIEFWFENKNAAAVKVGMKSKSCKCTGTAISMLPPERVAQRKLGAFAVAHGVLSGEFLPDVPVLVSGCREMRVPSPEPGLGWQDFERDDSKFMTVPPGAGGWIRLRWNGETPEPGPQQFTATFWMENEDAGTTVTLGVPVYLAEPLMVSRRNMEVGLLGPDRRNAQMEIVCWSATRSDFTLKPAAESADPFISFGTPVPMIEKEAYLFIKEVEPPTKPTGLVKVVYRVPVTVHESLPDGRQMELGPFTRKIVINTVPATRPVEVEIAGIVRGEVAIGVSPYRDQIFLGNFRLGTEREVDVPISSEQSDLELRIDKVPEFLKATLAPLKSDKAGKSWNLHVKVGADLADGQITPDTCIYLKTQTERRIRIPVRGIAYR